MRRDGSLPAIEGRGRGLADIKGTDPMDRRIEVEKQEKYAAALREQMANQQRPLEAEGGNGLQGFGRDGRNDGFECHTPMSRATGRSPRESRSGGSCPPAAATGFGGRLGPSQFAAAGAAICDPGGGFGPGPSGGGGVSTGYQTPGAASGIGSVQNFQTADKVAQVQDLMRGRIRDLQQQQDRHWEHIQGFMRGQTSEARDFADAAVKRQMDSFLGSHTQDMDRLRAEVERLTSQAAAEARRAVEQAQRQLEAMAGDRAGELASLREELMEESAQRSHECQRTSNELAEEVARLKRSVESILVEQHDHRSVLDVHEREIQKLKTCHEECVRWRADFRAEWQREQQKCLDELARARDDRDGFKGQVKELADQLRQLRGDLPRMISRQVEAEISRIPRPEQPRAITPPPPRPRSPPTDIPEDIFAVLRGGEDKTDLNYLPAMQNVVGRSPACNVKINNQCVSNQHARVDFTNEGKAVLKDMGSRNSTFINDKRVNPGEGLVLESGDSVRLGGDGPAFSFEYGPAALKMLPRQIVRDRDFEQRERSRGGTGGSGGRHANLSPGPSGRRR